MPRRDVTGYSRLVGGLKIALPILALLILSSIFLLPRQGGFTGGLVFSTADLLSLGEGLAVQNPRFSGSTEDGEPFVVRAASAVPDGPDPERIDLFQVEAELDQPERQVRLAAAAGSLRPRDQTLELGGGVVVTTDDGWRAETATVRADMRAGGLSAPGRVTAEGPRGSIEAGSFRAERIEAEDDGAKDVARFWFENRVRVTYVPAREDAAER